MPSWLRKVRAEDGTEFDVLLVQRRLEEELGSMTGNGPEDMAGTPCCFRSLKQKKHRFSQCPPFWLSVKMLLPAPEGRRNQTSAAEALDTSRHS